MGAGRIGAGPVQLRGAPVALLIAIATCLVVACKPVTEAGAAASATPTADAAGVLPDGETASLPALWATAAAAAAEWQEGARAVQADVWLRSDGSWERAAVRYVAAEAEHLLVVELAGGVVARERVALAAAGAEELLTAAAVAALPEADAGWLEPTDLAQVAATVVDACQLDAVARVVWTSGAPAGWVDGAWVADPHWQATLLDGAGRGAVVDPVSGEAVTDDACAAAG